MYPPPTLWKALIAFIVGVGWVLPVWPGLSSHPVECESGMIALEQTVDALKITVANRDLCASREDESWLISSGQSLAFLGTHILLLI